MGILRVLEGRGVHPSAPDRWILDALGGGGNPTASGATVSADTALSSTAVFAAIRLISETLASVPFKLYRRMDRGKEAATDHPLYRILHDEPNPEQTPIEFREMMESFRQTHGNAYAQIVWAPNGTPLELWPIVPHRVSVDRDPAGNLRYRVRIGDREDRYIRAEDMLHIRGFSRDGILGLDIITQMRESIGLTIATQEYGSRFFGNGAQPGGVLSHPAKLSPEAAGRLQKSWEQKHRGLENAHRVAILEEGMQWHQMGIPPEAAQYLETRKFQVSEVARIFNVPPHLLRDLDRATFSNIEMQSIEFVVYSMRPHYVRWEQSCNRKLLLPRERGEYFAQHVIEGLLRGDIKTRYEAYAVARSNGWMSANDIRELEDMNPIEDGGDVYLVPLNMVPADMAHAVPQGAKVVEEVERALPTPELRAVERRKASVSARLRLRAAHEPLFLAAAETVLAREIKAVRNALKKSYGARDAVKFRAWLDEYYERHGIDWVKAMVPVLRAYAGVVGDATAAEVGSSGPAALDEFVGQYAERFGRWQSGSSAGQLRQILRETPAEDVAEALETRLTEWEETRADKIARRESQRSLNALSVEAYAALGVMSLVWQTNGRNCPLCNTLDGRTVGMRSSFVESGGLVDPGDGATPPLQVEKRITHPPLHDGCDCIITGG